MAPTSLNIAALEVFRAVLLCKLDFHGLYAPKSAQCSIIASNRMRTNGGTANYRLNRIKLNKRLLETNPHHISQTLAHELAHLVAVELYGIGARGHGATWRRIMNAFGYPAKRCHSLDVSNIVVRHEAYCGCKTHHITSNRRNKMRRGVKYNCRLCKTVLKLKSEV